MPALPMPPTPTTIASKAIDLPPPMAAEMGPICEAAPGGDVGGPQRRVGRQPHRTEEPWLLCDCLGAGAELPIHRNRYAGSSPFGPPFPASRPGAGVFETPAPSRSAPKPATVATVVAAAVAARVAASKVAASGAVATVAVVAARDGAGSAVVPPAGGGAPTSSDACSGSGATSACGGAAGAASPPRSPLGSACEARARVALVASRFSARVPASSRRLPARVAAREPAPAPLASGARRRPTFVASARAAFGLVSALSARRALAVVAVLAAFPREGAPDLLVLPATRFGTAFRAAPRFAPAAFPPVVAVSVAGVRRGFRGAAVLEAAPPAAPAARARVAARLSDAAFGAPARFLPAVPWPRPAVPAAAVTAAPRRFGATPALLPPFPGAAAVRARPAGGFPDALPRAGAPADALAPLPAPGAARLVGLFPFSVGVLAIGSPRSFADVAPNHPRPLPERGQACEQPVPDRIARNP